MMRSVPTSAGDLVPLSERLRLLRFMRIGLVVLVVLGWLFAHGARGASFGLIAAASAGLLLTTAAIEALARAWHGRVGWVFGVTAMLDAAFLAWASYATAGLSSPLTYLLLIQLMTVSLLASSRTGVKLALWDSLLLISAHYAARANILHYAGAKHVRLSGGWSAIAVAIAVYWLVALATSTFAAVNERELRRRRYDLEALASLALRMDEADESAAVAEVLVREIADTFDYQRALVLEPSNGQLRVLASHGLEPGAWARGSTIAPAAAPTVTAALEQNRRLLVAHAETRSDIALNGCAPARDAIIIPLHADRTLGVLILEHGLRRGSRVERRVVTMLERFCSHAALALANSVLLERIRDQALTDTLTGLANRGQLDAELARACAEARREQRPLSLVMIDLDNFKQLNDQHGHQIGDRILQLTGRALAQTTRATDVAARYGGEEFCVVMPGAEIETAELVAERLRRAIAERCSEYSITASAGVACASPETVTPETLVRAADSALYAAKHAGRNTLVRADAVRLALFSDESRRPGDRR